MLYKKCRYCGFAKNLMEQRIVKKIYRILVHSEHLHMQIQQNSPSCAQENLHIQLKKDQSPAIFSLAYSKVQYEHGQFWKRIFHTNQ